MPDKPQQDPDAMIGLRIATTRAEVSIWKWAAGRKYGRTFDAFVLEAMRAATSETVKEWIAKGKPVPHFIAEALDKKTGV